MIAPIIACWDKITKTALQTRQLEQQSVAYPALGKPLSPFALRTRRLMLGMSQTALGDVLGITFEQVQKYEKGTNRVGASRLQHISQILQVPVEFLFEDAPPAPGQRKQTSDAPLPDYDLPQPMGSRWSRRSRTSTSPSSGVASLTW